MTGATSSTDGASGLVPKPVAANYNKYLRGDGTWATPTNTTYSSATSTTYGLVKIGYTESGKNYPVELNADGQMYVNVPWTDNNTTYDAATASTLGLVKVHSVKTTAVTVNSASTTSNRYYPVEMNNDNKLFVNVPWSNTTYGANNGISLSGTTFSHSNSITAATISGTSSTTSLSHGGTVSIPSITYDAQGHITSATTTTFKLPDAQTSVTGNAGTATKLATTRYFTTNLGSTASGGFDGSANCSPGVSGVLPVSNGGTGSSSHTSNAILAGNGSGALKNIATASGALYSTGANSAAVFGTLPIAQGGTGATSASGVRTNLGLRTAAWGTCSTDAATAAKVVTTTGNTNWALEAGAIVTVLFSATNTAQNPTLNVNGTGAKNIYYQNGQITTGSLDYAGYANRPMNFMYDGTQYRFIGWGVDSNSDTKVTQAAAITTSADYSIILAYSTATTAVTNTVNKTTTLKYNPGTQALTVPNVTVSSGISMSTSAAAIK